MGANEALAVTYQASGVTVTRALIGDANLDGDVDVFEFDGGGDAQVLTANLGTARGATWADGDFNGDGDVDVFEFTGTGDAQLLTANLGAAAGVAAGSTAAAEEASATYDPSTGEVVITVGGHLGVVGLGSAAGNLLPGEALAAAQGDASAIAFFDPAGLEPGEFALGRVVRAGTAASDLFLGFTVLGGGSTNVELTVVPEPAALAVLAVAGPVLLGRRRLR